MQIKMQIINFKISFFFLSFCMMKLLLVAFLVSLAVASSPWKNMEILESDIVEGTPYDWINESAAPANALIELTISMKTNNRDILEVSE